MYENAINFFKDNGIDLDKFDYFDYADFFDTLDQQTLKENPKKRIIVQRFLQKCQQKLLKKERNKDSWKRFLQRVQQQKKYRKQKMQALKFINQHYDNKNDQLLFYPRVNKTHATQQGRYWKDLDDTVSEQGTIFKPNESTFEE